MLLKLYFIVLILKNVLGEFTERPIGVSLERALLYKSADTFTCLDGTLTIPYEYVNDDYCDCNYDGSDEPGTSACPNGSFYCINVGFMPKYVPSSRVNDGICDCCDGSDEYDSNTKCENNCNILGKAAKEEQERRREIIKEGNVIRLQLIQKGKELKTASQIKYKDLSKEAELSEINKKKQEEIKIKMEEVEKAALDVYRAANEQLRLQREEEEKRNDEQAAFKIFVEIDTNDDKKINLEELKKYEVHDRYNTKLITDDEAKLILGSEETMNFESFLSLGWTQFKQVNLSSLFQPPTTEPSTTEPKIVTEEDEKYVGDKDADKPIHDSEYTPDEENDDDDDDDEDIEESEGKGDIVEEHPESENLDGENLNYDENTLKLIEEANNARKEFEDADRILRDLSREMKQIEDILNKDYGHNDEYAYMDGECYEYPEKEYIYRLCPFDQVTQMQKHGGVEIRLGRWQNWSDPYNSMLYNNGQSCWNGPNRQTEVKLLCGLETEVTYASEPNRCMYLLHLKTPSACTLDEPLNEEEPFVKYHDEL